MDDSYSFAHCSVLQIRHYFPQYKQHLHDQFTGIAGYDELLIVLGVENFRLGWLDAIAIVKIKNYLFDLLVDGTLFDDVLSRIAICDEEVGGYGG